MNECEGKTVNIPIDEYFEFRTKAEMKGSLIQQLEQLEGKVYDLERRICELEWKLKEEKK